MLFMLNVVVLCVDNMLNVECCSCSEYDKMIEYLLCVDNMLNVVHATVCMQKR